METKSKEILSSQIELVPYNSASHLQKLTNWLQDKKLMHGWGMDTFENSEEVNKWASDSTRVVLMVKDVSSDEIVGMVNFYSWDKEKKVASRGTLIDPKFQNKGYGKVAIIASNKYAFDEMKLTRIELYVEGYNVVSRHITEKLGYKFDGYNPQKDRYYYFMDNPGQFSAHDEEPSEYMIKALRESEDDRKNGKVSSAFSNAKDAVN